MRFDKLDLNQLIVLDALLRDRSVSLAAERIELSQSATSSALSRLRVFFDDDLLVMRGRAMVLTPRATELIQPVATILGLIRDTITTPKQFDPALSDRRLGILTSDYSLEVLLAPALRGIAKDAPSMSFHILAIEDDPVVQLERGAVDVSITVDTGISTEHPSTCLFSDDFVVIGWKDNPALNGAMTAELYSSLGHVVTRFGRSQLPSFEEFALRHGSIRRRIEVVAPNFVAVASLVRGSSWIATMHRRLAERLRQSNELALFEAPIPMPPIRITAQWLTAATRDPAVAWFVQRLQAQAAQEFGCVPSDDVYSPPVPLRQA